MKKPAISCLLFLLICLPFILQAQQPETIKIIMDRVMNDLKKPAKSVDAAAETNLKNIQPDGSWKGIDYQNKEISLWQPARHLANLETLIQAYVGKESRYYGDEKLLNLIAKSFQYWYESDPKSNNWWHNEIATPQALGEMLILMRYGKQPLAAQLEQKLLVRMNRGDINKQTGANKADVALHYFYRALLTNNQELLQLSVAELFEPIQLVYQKEGIQYDFSYLQHGPQLQISSYGLVFIIGVLKMANYVRGTEYALADAKLQIFSKYYRESYLKAIRGSYTDFNIEGRGISRPNILERSHERSRLLVAQLLDIDHSADWKAALARVEGKEGPGYAVLPAHQQFWNGDYIQHIRKDYSFNVRMVSKRTKRSEAGNQENLLGRYLSDGATNIQLRGSEYYNIMPVWEWDKIPGITSRDYAVDRQITQFWGEQGSNDFAGGVSDGIYGAGAYVLDYDSLKAKKSWFFFDQEIVCLGAGISSGTAENITTTINQCWLNGEVMAQDNQHFDKGKSLTLQDAGKQWVLHDGVGYYFPQGGNIKVSTEAQKGNWFQINRSYAKNEISGNVFKLWIDHGAKPQSGQYAYYVLPALKDAKALKNYKTAAIEIISNTEKMQVVYHQGLDILQAILYEPGSFILNGKEITCEKACALMIKDFKGKQAWLVADPLQKESQINLRLKDIATGKTISHEAVLPKRELAGSSVTLN